MKNLLLTLLFALTALPVFSQTAGQWTINRKKVSGNGYTSMSATPVIGEFAKVDANGNLTFGAAGGGAWGTITGTLSSQTDLQNALNALQPLATPLTNFSNLASSAGFLLNNGSGTLTYSLDGSALTGLTVAQITDFDPADYLPLAGGMMTGPLDLDSWDLNHVFEINDGGGVLTIQAHNRTLNDTAGVAIYDWSTGVLVGDGSGLTNLTLANIAGFGTGVANALAATPNFAQGLAIYDGGGRLTVPGTVSTRVLILRNNLDTIDTTITSSATVNRSVNFPDAAGTVLFTNGSGASLTALNATQLTSGTVPAARMPALTGDITTSTGDVATTLATVNSNVGTFGSATHYATVTVNAKGLITAASETVWPTFNQNTSGTAASLSGILATTLGGTGVNNAGTLTNASNTTITGGGTLALGGFTATVPATGTVALRNVANSFGVVTTTGVQLSGSNAPLYGTGNICIGNATSPFLMTVYGSTGLSMLSTGAFFWTNGASYNGTPDTFLYRESAATIQMGADSATPIAQTFKGADARAGTDSNTAGGSLTLSAGLGTGTGTASSVIIKAPTTVASGTGAQTSTTAATFTATTTDLAATLKLGGTTFLTNIGATMRMPYDTATWNSSALTMGPSNYIGWSASAAGNGSADVALYRDAAYILQLGTDAASATSQGFKAHDGSGTDKDGANMNFGGGASTGTGKSGDVIIKTGLTSTTGSSANSYSTRRYDSAKQVTLTESTATTFCNVGVASSKYAGAKLVATVTANDGTDFQCLTSELNVNAINKAGTVTTTLTQVDGTTAASAGTLTATYTAVVNGNSVDIKCDATSSLTQTVLTVKWNVLSLNSDGADTTLCTGSLITPQ